MAIEQVDLWGHVQRRVWPAVGEAPEPPPSNVRMIGLRSTLHVRTDDEWTQQRFRARADEILTALDEALAKRRTRRAARLRAAWLHQVHLDRIEAARAAAKERGLRLDPAGRGPLVDHESVCYRDRLPWHLVPVGRYGTHGLPDRAAVALDGWNDAGVVFDAVYIAQEPIASGHFPVRSLIGAISADGRTGEWFVLDHWAC